MTDNARFSSVFFRKYIFQLIISLLCLVFVTVLSFSVCEKATKGYAERQRYKNAGLNEIIYSSSPGYEESLYCFGGSAYAFFDGHRLSADVLMTVGDVEYEGNPLYLRDRLDAGSCAVSKNLALKFNIRCGDTLTVTAGSDEKSFTFMVSELLTAQSGIDAKYMHEGVIVLSENAGLTETAKHIFVSFAKDWSGEYPNLVTDPARGASVVFSKDVIKSAEGRLTAYALLSTLALWIFIAVSEIFIFSKMGKKYRDYSILCTYGIPRRRLFGTVFLDSCIKYILPCVISFLIWLLRLRVYGAAYLAPSAAFLTVAALSALILSLITVMRKNRCPKIRR